MNNEWAGNGLFDHFILGYFRDIQNLFHLHFPLHILLVNVSQDHELDLGVESQQFVGPAELFIVMHRM